MNSESSGGNAMAQDDAAAQRVSFDRLRERTDELELIISGLSLYALLSLPGWLWTTYENYAPRMSLTLAAASVVLLPTISAICIVMAVLFVLHLAVRAHWVGLIGLKAVFPAGVRWEKLQGLGPVTLALLQRKLPSLDLGIERADRVASTLFSLITFSAISMAVLGFWLCLILVLAGLFGDALGGTNTFANLASFGIFLAYFAVPLLRWLLDGVLARWLPVLARWRVFRGAVLALTFLEGLFFPLRVLGVTRYALQSNVMPKAFFAVFMVAVMASMFGSTILFSRGANFDLLGSQNFVSGREVSGGLRSTYYESQRVSRDALLSRPLIPDPLIQTAWLPVFLPYTALIDDPVLRSRCPPRKEVVSERSGFESGDSDEQALIREAEIDVATLAASECLRRLWSISLDGKPQSMDGFIVSERADLRLRGLSGWLPLNGLSPGPHRLEVIWRPRPEQDDIVEDYVPRRIRHVIPFVWSPDAAAVPAATASH